MDEIRQYGLIGKKLDHSFSPSYFKKKFSQESIKNAEYKAYEIDDISDVLSLLKGGVCGLNVTIPYKEKVIPYMDKLIGDAEKINAVNTIKIVDNELLGYNTDVHGFRQSIAPFLSDIDVRKVLILGTGGASKAVRYVCDEYGFETYLVSRSKGDMDYNMLASIGLSDYTVIVNTTPLGTYPHIGDKPPIPYASIGPQHFMIDLIYNPKKTLFLDEGLRRGATILNGLEMLKLQAEKSWQIWNS